MIPINELKKIGFIDVSSDQNGLGYRLRLPNSIMEFCYYVYDQHIRLQTIRSGITIPLKGINTMNEFLLFYYSITGNNLITKNLKS